MGRGAQVGPRLPPVNTTGGSNLWADVGTVSSAVCGVARDGAVLGVPSDRALAGLSTERKSFAVSSGASRLAGTTGLSPERL